MICGMKGSLFADELDMFFIEMKECIGILLS
jgi:hypothetical protein